MTTKAEHYNTITSLQILVSKLARRRDEWKARAEKEHRFHNATQLKLQEAYRTVDRSNEQLRALLDRVADLEAAVNIYAREERRQPDPDIAG